MYTDIRKILHLHESGKSIRWISRELDKHRKTVAFYINRFGELQITSEELSQKTDFQIAALFECEQLESDSKHEHFIKFVEVHRVDRNKPGYTILNLFKIYQQSHPDGYGRSQFYDRYSKLVNEEKGSVRIPHKYGDKLFIDFAGKSLSIIDKTTGEIQEAKVFVGILPASNYTYVEAVTNEKKETLISATGNCLEFIDGVPACIVPDNLKSAVSKASKFEPILNKSFKDMADHYDTVINPTRSYSPKDKAMVEGMVRIVYQEIYFPLRNMVFFSLHELNKEIGKYLSILNNKPLSNRTESRHDLYIQEKEYLKPLPKEKYEMWDYKKAKVQKMGYVFLSAIKNYYSVPYRYIGKQIELRYNASILEVYYRSERIATHKISEAKGYYTTITEHLCSANQYYLEWSPSFFIAKASKVGMAVEQYIKELIHQSQYPEVAYRQSLGILSLQKKYGTERLNDACEMAGNHKKRSYTMIKQILENRTDIIWKDAASEVQVVIPLHENIRGKETYL
jgi:hypothetical protein